MTKLISRTAQYAQACTVGGLGSTPLAPRAKYKSAQPQPGIHPATFSMSGNHLAYEAT